MIASDRVFFVIQNSDGEIEVLVDREDESVDGAVAFAEDGVLSDAVAHGRPQFPLLARGVLGNVRE